jgi:hypothetical protein
VTFRFDQRYQTAASAQWALLDDAGATLGRIDAHFEPGRARVTLVVATAVDDTAAEDLVATIDETLVPALSRGDVRISVWRGESLGTFAPQG